MIANENYLRTARKRSSIRKLLNLVGVRLKGPISAATNARIVWPWESAGAAPWAGHLGGAMIITPANRVICGQADVMVNTFTMSLENDAAFLGRGASGVPEVISRQGEFSATADMNVKYDDESADLLNMFQAATSGASTGNTILSNASTPADGASWGFQFPQAIFTSVALSEGDIMGIDASVKMVGFGTGTSTTCATIAD